MRQWEAYQRELINKAICSQDSTDFDVVIIIGESFIRTHSSLYGYYLQTNPHLKTEADSNRLYIFNDVISPANFISLSIRNTLNLNDVSNDEHWSEFPYLPLLMKKAGRSVYHYDNQTISPLSDVGLSRMFYADVINQNVLDGFNDRQFKYDGDYVNYVHNELLNREICGKKFIMYHVMGQHFKCADRFPGKPFFKSSDIKTKRPWISEKERQEIADYNNANLYNDSVIHQIISRFKNGNAIVIYFSDHGEDSYELAMVKGRNVQSPEDSDWLDRQFHIPFFVWVSDAFKKSYPEKVEAIKNAVNRPWSTDNLGQMVLGLCEIKTKFYRPERDILSDKFKPYQRKTASGYNYDSICNRR